MRNIVLSLCLTTAIGLTSCQNTEYSQSTDLDTRPTFVTSERGDGYLTPEVINSDPSLSGPSLRSAKISPDGNSVTVLQSREDNARIQDLWAYDLETGEGQRLVSASDILGGEEVLSEEEKNRRERAREYSGGIISYAWVGETLLLFPLGGDIYLYDTTTKSSRQVTATKGYETDAKVTADGRFVSYVRANELYIKDLNTGLERQLSEGSSDTIRNGIASFVVQEELGRYTGYWVNSDATRIAYTQIDESPIAIESRIDFCADGIKTIAQRYPFAGTDNATLKLAVTDRTGSTTHWMDLGEDQDIYLTRVTWSKDGNTLFAGILSRDNKTHTILKLDPDSGESEVFYRETSPTWLNIRSSLNAMADGSLHWISERDGKRKLYALTENQDPKALTPDDILLGGLSCQMSDGTLFFTGWKDDPKERHIFRQAPDGTVTQISSGAGLHGASFSQDCNRYIGTFTGIDTPSQVRAFDQDGNGLAWLNQNQIDDTHPYAPYTDTHITPEFGILQAEDGSDLHYVLYKPLDLQPGEKRPSITLVYGGPGVQRVTKSWRRTLFPRMLAQHGFVVFQIDGRGSTNRGKAFEDILYRKLGQAEVIDQSVGAQWLQRQDFIDPDRMGIYGWSYGGYMVLQMLGQTDFYKSGVSGAPVTDWALYDTAYTERYLGDPNPGTPNYTQGAYEDGSVFAHLDGLTEDVLVIHGMADDNVVFRHTVKLLDAMQDKGAQNMRLMTYPGEKHGFRRQSNRIHRDRMILDYFVKTLGE